MSRSSAWLGIDLGTSGLKVLAVGADGSAVAETEVTLGVDRPAAGHAEASVGSWLAAVDDTVRPLAERLDIRGVGVTGQMHGTVLVDEAGTPVRPALLWPDARAGQMRARWEGLGAETLRSLGGPFSPGMTGPVLAWLAEHEPESAARAAHVTLPKDIVRAHLCAPGAAGDADRWATDPSDAAGTLLRDVVAGTWSPAATKLVPARLLPSVVPSNSVVGAYGSAPVVAGGGDTPVSMLALEAAAGGWRPGDVIVNLGTGAQVIDPRSSGDVLVSENGTGWPVTHTYDDCTGGRYTMVAAQNGGLAVGWALQRLGIDWTRFAELASRATPGADGVLFSPFVTSERGALRSRPTLGPGWTAPPGQDPTEVAAARAVAEAQVFLVRRSMEIVQVTPTRVLLAGGGGRDHWVRQLLADVLDVPVHYLPVRSAAAAGAVVLAGGPALLQVGQSTAAGLIEPRPVPALEDAYDRWREHCYGAIV